ncbi:hypothetical protein Q5M85_15170 [Paraclostridium bifermentans]|nr:hypothetical protein [Paraclostridium bifermentans]
MKYIKDNNIETIGDFHEIYIMTRVGMDGKEKSLGQNRNINEIKMLVSIGLSAFFAFIENNSCKNANDL